MVTTSLPLKVKTSYTPILSVDLVMRHAKAVGASRLTELDQMVYSCFSSLKTMGLNPDVLVGISNLETDHWRSAAWADRLNPGGIGITDSQDQMISFTNGTDAGMALGVHLMAYAFGHNNKFAKYIHLDPRFIKVHQAGFAGIAKVLGDLGNGKWATDPLYASKVAARIEEMRL